MAFIRCGPLVKTIPNPADDDETPNKKTWSLFFAKEQGGCRKDVERAFGVLQSWWAIVRHPARTWSVDTMWEVMSCCVIMHNMIVEDERDGSLFDKDWEFSGEATVPQFGSTTFAGWIEFHREMRDKIAHRQLQKDLVKHMWNHFRNQES